MTEAQLRGVLKKLGFSDKDFVALPNEQPGGGKVLAGNVKLTPEHAKELLRFNTKNRPITPSQSAKLRQLLSDGKFIWSPHGLVFTDEPRVGDGQHRLKEIGEGAVTVDMFVLVGVHEKALAAVDTPTTRSDYEIAKLSGRLEGKSFEKKHFQFAKAMMSYGKPYHRGDGIPVRREPDTAYEYVEKFEDGINFAFEQLSGAPGRLKQATFGAVFAKAFYYEDVKLLSEMCQILRDGYLPGKNLEKTNAAVLLRRKFVDEAANQATKRGPKKSRGQGGSYQSLIYKQISQCVSKYCSGEEMSNLTEASKDLYPLPKADDQQASPEPVRTRGKKSRELQPA